MHDSCFVSLTFICAYGNLFNSTLMGKRVKVLKCKIKIQFMQITILRKEYKHYASNGILGEKC